MTTKNHEHDTMTKLKGDSNILSFPSLFALPLMHAGLAHVKIGCRCCYVFWAGSDDWLAALPRSLQAISCTSHDRCESHDADASRPSHINNAPSTSTLYDCPVNIDRQHCVYESCARLAQLEGACSKAASQLQWTSMSSRRPLQPIPAAAAALPAKVSGTRYALSLIHI